MSNRIPMRRSICTVQHRSRSLSLVSSQVGNSPRRNKESTDYVHDHFALYMPFRLKNPERKLALERLEYPA